jgi:hypothetical protein
MHGRALRFGKPFRANAGAARGISHVADAMEYS